jgi:hypothetical protein
MSDYESRSSRIDAEVAAAVKKFKDLQLDRLRECRERRKRLRQLDGVFEKLAEVWKPRLDTLLQTFGDRVQVTPRPPTPSWKAERGPGSADDIPPAAASVLARTFGRFVVRSFAHAGRLDHRHDAGAHCFRQSVPALHQEG